MTKLSWKTRNLNIKVILAHTHIQTHKYLRQTRHLHIWFIKPLIHFTFHNARELHSHCLKKRNINIKQKTNNKKKSKKPVRLFFHQTTFPGAILRSMRHSKKIIHFSSYSTQVDGGIMKKKYITQLINYLSLWSFFLVVCLNFILSMSHKWMVKWDFSLCIVNFVHCKTSIALNMHTTKCYDSSITYEYVWKRLEHHNL